MMPRRYCLTLELKNDPALIAQYCAHHARVWPEVLESIRTSGVTGMEIYLHDTRLVMVMEVDETFSFEAKARADAANPKVQEWERLMWTFQQPLPGTPPGGKWLLMEEIFSLAGPRP
jgi:L-rhamnose mutarotase